LIEFAVVDVLWLTSDEDLTYLQAKGEAIAGNRTSEQEKSTGESNSGPEQRPGLHRRRIEIGATG
jgi:hypothetical protein